MVHNLSWKKMWKKNQESYIKKTSNWQNFSFILCHTFQDNSWWVFLMFLFVVVCLFVCYFCLEIMEACISWVYNLLLSIKQSTQLNQKNLWAFWINCKVCFIALFKEKKWRNKKGICLYAEFWLNTTKPKSKICWNNDKLIYWFLIILMSLITLPYDVLMAFYP